MLTCRFFLLILISPFIFPMQQVHAQKVDWHSVQRKLHYRPQGKDFVKVEGRHRFNRALYGSNTGFRVEAGDLPEFALYMPAMGGNLKFELISGNLHKWIIDAEQIETIYRPGSMIYTLKDPMLDKGKIVLTVLALMEGEGILLKTEAIGIPKGIQLGLVFGGASGKKFSRDGDIGADPESSFDLKPENCSGNIYTINKNTFSLKFNIKKDVKELKGIFPEHTNLSIAQFDQPGTPYLKGNLNLGTTQTDYFLISNVVTNNVNEYSALSDLFKKTELQRSKLADRVIVRTPDSFINTLGGALAVASDAIYESPTFLHGAVAWRMRLNAWRGAYAADPLGWHDRARSHFSSYAKSQVTEPLSGPVVADTALGMARQLEQMGTSLFSSGYICRNPDGDIRPHHYDMNLVFIDQLLNHFNWTGDTAYVRAMWPLIKRHLAWEKRNFDADNDGLYDAYASIWASDALQYNGGAVTHSSAYNYRANKSAGKLAKILHEDSSPYEDEAKKIHNAIRLALWLPRLGSYAEYRDNTASRNLHTAAGLWTIYHTLDAGVPDPFEAYQALQYIDNDIPHIPVKADGLKDTGLYVLATSNWQPYTWSVNNVALAENLHTALAYWLGGNKELAFTLWKSSLIESMFVSTSPGNFEQLSFYDAFRGELYRDFADPIGMASRTLVEGLFGIQPNALLDTLCIHPGLPASWNKATLQVPDISFDFTRNDLIDQYIIKPSFEREMNLLFTVPALYSEVESVMVNGKQVQYTLEPSISSPQLVIALDKQQQYKIMIQWKNKPLATLKYEPSINNLQRLNITAGEAEILELKDPQLMLKNAKVSANALQVTVSKDNHYGTFFIKIKQGNTIWWEPVNLNIKQQQHKNISDSYIVKKSEPVDLSAYFNDKVSHIFQQKYLSPRSPHPTLQLPVQGIGNWCYPKVQPEINDSGLRALAGRNNSIHLENGTTLQTPSSPEKGNIIFTSLWDNYPDSVTVPVSGKGKYMAAMLCGSTNHMQSQMENGQLIVTYTDGTQTILSLRNPENWWPVEQDYFEDEYAFHLKEKPPVRIHLKSGKIYNGFAPDGTYSTLKGFSNRMIEGGAATVLDLKIDPSKGLKSVTLKTTASEVVIGLMAITVIKETKDDKQVGNN
jgi:hypothetical protein